MSDRATTAQEGDEDGDSVGDGEADRCYAGEGVEGRCGSEVDAAEDAVDDCGEREAEEGDIVFGGDLLPESASGDGTVAGEGVCAARCGG